MAGACPTDRATVQYRCLICCKTLSTKSHLRRHEATHSRDRSSKCPFCHRVFLRLDTVRRHSEKCSQREEHCAVPTAKRGRKPQACDSCRSQKARCDGSQPCERCSSGQVECSYSYVNGTAGRIVLDCAPTSPCTSRSTSEESLNTRCVPVSFLLSYTDPSLESTTDSFVAAEAHAEAVVEQFEYRTENHQPASYMSEGDNEGLFSSMFSDLFLHLSAGSNGPRSTPPSLVQSSALETRIKKLISQLAAQYQIGFENDRLAATAFPMDLANAVFTTTNLANYVLVYFNRVHPHFPFIHRPTFDIQTSSLPLILAIALCGSAHSAPHDDTLSARDFFSLGEEYIFGLLSKIVTKSDQTSDEDSIQTLQAATLIYTLQSSSNNAGIRHRIRVKRHPKLVASIRSLRLVGIKRTTLLGTIDWCEFIAEEIRVRLVTSIFLADCMNTVFFNSPPQITVSEMLGDLPCADALFEASTAAEFGQLTARAVHSTPQPPSLKDWITSFLQQTWLGSKHPNFHSVEPQHLLISIFALHSIIYVSRTGLLVSSSSQALLHATNCWKELWDVVHARHEARQLKSIGFRKYGLEIWWLAQTLLEVAQSNDLRSRYMKGIPTDSLGDLHEFIKLYANK